MRPVVIPGTYVPTPMILYAHQNARSMCKESSAKLGFSLVEITSKQSLEKGDKMNGIYQFLFLPKLSNTRSLLLSGL